MMLHSTAIGKLGVRERSDVVQEARQLVGLQLDEGCGNTLDPLFLPARMTTGIWSV